MSAPRTYQFIALKRLAAGSRRQLHMTGPATYSSPMLNSERSVSNLPRDIAGLRAECKRRRLDLAGSQQDLMNRLSADDVAHSRAFTTAIESSKRPSADQKKEETTTVRHFNTSRTLKAIKDSSTVDFAYLPDFDPENAEATLLRVPFVPTNFSPVRTGVHAPEASDEAVMRPEINSMAVDKIISNFSEVTDNTAMSIDFNAMAEGVAAATNKVKAPVVAQAGMFKQLWGGLMEDIKGTNKPSTA